MDARIFQSNLAPYGLDSIIIGLPPGPWPHLTFIRVSDVMNYFEFFDVMPAWELPLKDLDVLANRLHDIAEEKAAGMNPPEQIMNEWWLLTQDPDEVTTYSRLHDCVACRASVDQALAGMRGGRTVAFGFLAWADR